MPDPMLAVWALILLTGVAAAWAATRRRRTRREIARFDDVPHLCMRCGRLLPQFQVHHDDDQTEVVVITPLGVACESTGITGWLCSRDCTRAWVEQHMALHHPGQEQHP